MSAASARAGIDRAAAVPRAGVRMLDGCGAFTRGLLWMGSVMIAQRTAMSTDVSWVCCVFLSIGRHTGTIAGVPVAPFGPIGVTVSRASCGTGTDGMSVVRMGVSPPGMTQPGRAVSSDRSNAAT